TLNFLLDDPNQPTATVSLRGQGTAGAIAVMPLTVDFGGVPFGKTSSSRQVTLSNTGAAILQITDLSFNNAAFQFPVKPAVPANLPPGGAVMYDVVFA